MQNGTLFIEGDDHDDEITVTGLVDYPDGTSWHFVSLFTMRDGKTYAGRMFVDATYEGDLMAAAGVSFAVGREAHPGLKLGICGEHGGEAKSVAFCHRLGLDYVSCSPYRVPLARLAAAQAALAEQGVVSVAVGG